MKAMFEKVSSAWRRLLEAIGLWRQHNATPGTKPESPVTFPSITQTQPPVTPAPPTKRPLTQSEICGRLISQPTKTGEINLVIELLDPPELRNQHYVQLKIDFEAPALHEGAKAANELIDPVLQSVLQPDVLHPCQIVGKALCLNDALAGLKIRMVQDRLVGLQPYTDLELAEFIASQNPQFNITRNTDPSRITAYFLKVESEKKQKRYHRSIEEIQREEGDWRSD